MRDKFKYIFYSIILIGVFLLGTQTCKNTSKSDFKPITDTLIVHKTDTIRDTIPMFKFKIKPVLTYTPIVSLDSTKKLSFYEDTYRDSNLVVFIKDTIDGKILSRKIDYRLLIPTRIVDSTKIYITTTKLDTIYKIPKIQIKTGILATKGNIFGIVDLNIKKVTYTVGFDPFNKQTLVGLKYTIFSK